jgi:hypothetical protein
MNPESGETLGRSLRFCDDLVPPRWDLRMSGLEVWRDNRGLACAYGQVAGGQPWMRVVGIGDFRLEPSGSAVAVPDAGVPRTDVIDVYYRNVLPMALQLGGYEVLHASAVVAPQGVLALCAASETGKSTLAYALSRRGHELFADDAVALDAAGPCPTLARVPFALRLRKASADHFGEPSRELVRVSGPHLAWAGREPRLAAICVLERIAGDRPEDGPVRPVDSAGPIAQVEPLPQATAFAAILPHAYCFSLGDQERKKRMMRNYLSLVRLVPVLRLRFRPGLGHLSEILEVLESALAEYCQQSRGPLSEYRRATEAVTS